MYGIAHNTGFKFQLSPVRNPTFSLLTVKGISLGTCVRGLSLKGLHNSR